MTGQLGLPLVAAGELTWARSHGKHPHALSLVDGTGPWRLHGPHYSRRTPGSASFVGCGRQLVLTTPSAVWSVVLQRPPRPRNEPRTGKRGRATPDSRPMLWRNNVFRNLGPALSSMLIRAAVSVTYREWYRRYGDLPTAQLRTEVDTRFIRSRNPGYCYLMAGWTKAEATVRHKLYLYAPERTA